MGTQKKPAILTVPNKLGTDNSTLPASLLVHGITFHNSVPQLPVNLKKKCGGLSTPAPSPTQNDDYSPKAASTSFNFRSYMRLSPVMGLNSGTSFCIALTNLSLGMSSLTNLSPMILY